MLHEPLFCLLIILYGNGKATFVLNIHVTVHRKRFLVNNQPDALIIQIYCHKTLHVSGILSAHHQEFSTVHSALVSFMQVLMTASKQNQDGTAIKHLKTKNHIVQSDPLSTLWQRQCFPQYYSTFRCIFLSPLPSKLHALGLIRTDGLVHTYALYMYTHFKWQILLLISYTTRGLATSLH